MAPRPQIIGQSAHAPEGPDAAASVAPIAEGLADTPAAMVEPAPAVRLDPTRYGDWERNGRCIDF